MTMIKNDTLVLYSYYRSSCAYRVRIALHCKKLPFEYRSIHLLKDGGEQYKESYLKLNPKGEVPFLIHHQVKISQSMAIINYLDEVFPEPFLFPRDKALKAQCLAFCEVVNSGIQPLHNLRVLQELEKRYQISAEEKIDWSAHWIRLGLKVVENFMQENKMAETSTEFCLGNTLSACDLFLAPLIYSAQRNKVDWQSFPRVKSVGESILARKDFQLASPHCQIDTPAEER